MLKVINPANGRLVATQPTDTAVTIRKKFACARAAQPAWARTPPRQRPEVVLRFREQLVPRREELARMLTREMGKPITQSRGELKGVLARIDFFLAGAASIL